MNVEEKPYIDLYNSEHYGLKYIFSDGYSGFNSYLIARDNYLSLDVHDMNALVNNVKLAHNVDSNIFIDDEIRGSIFDSINMFDTLIVNNEFQTIISGAFAGGIIITLSAVFPYFFYNYYYYNSVFRTELNIYYFRMKRRKKKEEKRKKKEEVRKRKNKCVGRTKKKFLKELEKISKSEFLEIYFLDGKDDFPNKDFNAEENLMFHKSIKIVLKIG